MKNLELTRMEHLSGGKGCVGATIGAGVSGFIVGAVGGPATAALGWLAGGIGGLVGCIIDQQMK